MTNGVSTVATPARNVQIPVTGVIHVFTKFSRGGIGSCMVIAIVDCENIFSLFSIAPGIKERVLLILDFAVISCSGGKDEFAKKVKAYGATEALFVADIVTGVVAIPYVGIFNLSNPFLKLTCKLFDGAAALRFTKGS
jgi:hypothetical protein